MGNDSDQGKSVEVARNEGDDMSIDEGIADADVSELE